MCEIGCCFSILLLGGGALTPALIMNRESIQYHAVKVRAILLIMITLLKNRVRGALR